MEEEGLPLAETGSSSEEGPLALGLSSCLLGQTWATFPVLNHLSVGGWDDSWTIQRHWRAGAGSATPEAHGCLGDGASRDKMGVLIGKRGEGRYLSN